MVKTAEPRIAVRASTRARKPRNLSARLLKRVDEPEKKLEKKDAKVEDGTSSSPPEATDPSSSPSPEKKRKPRKASSRLKDIVKNHLVVVPKAREEEVNSCGAPVGEEEKDDALQSGFTSPLASALG